MREAGRRGGCGCRLGVGGYFVDICFFVGGLVAVVVGGDLLDIFAVITVTTTFATYDGSSVRIPSMGGKRTEDMFVGLRLPALAESARPPMTSKAITAMDGLRMCFRSKADVLGCIGTAAAAPVAVTGLAANARVASMPTTTAAMAMYNGVPTKASLPANKAMTTLGTMRLRVADRSTITSIILDNSSGPLRA